MEQVSAERKLTIAYILCTVLGATASITNGIAWGHWKPTLDQCVNGRNCSCILYGQYTPPSRMIGGQAAPCIWVTFGPLIYMLFTIAMACFHGYRVLFSSRSTTTHSIMRKNEVGESVEVRAIQVEDTSTLPKAFWVAMCVLTVFYTIYGLIHFSIFLDGFYHTCNQYRKALEKILGVQGTAIPVIHGRLSCQGIFDFMDYMHMDSGNAYRDGYIFTGLDLILGIVASFFSWIIFAFAAYINIQLARKPQ